MDPAPLGGGGAAPLGLERPLLLGHLGHPGRPWGVRDCLPMRAWLAGGRWGGARAAEFLQFTCLMCTVALTKFHAKFASSSLCVKVHLKKKSGDRKTRR